MRSHVAGGMLAVGKASLVAGAAIGTGIVTGLALSVKQAMEAQKVQAQTAAVLKSTGGAAHVSSKQVNDMIVTITAKWVITGATPDITLGGIALVLVGVGNEVLKRTGNGS